MTQYTTSPYRPATKVELSELLPEDVGSEEAGASTSAIDHQAPQWSDARAALLVDEKTLIADYYAEHEFLLQFETRELASADERRRNPSASILLNVGTQPDLVARSVLKWVEKNRHLGPFFLIWYTPGHLIPETLRQFRTKKGNQHMAAAVKLFLLPGEVDFETQSVSGPDAEAFVQNLRRRFTYAFLSAYAFDIYTGDVYFHGARELALQRGIATRFAASKFLFLDSSKLKPEGDGECGYTVRELLETSHSVTIYTVSVSEQRDRWIMDGFEQLCGILQSSGHASTSKKRLCLRIVNRHGQLTNKKTMHEGFLVPA